MINSALHIIFRLDKINIGEEFIRMFRILDNEDFFLREYTLYFKFTVDDEE